MITNSYLYSNATQLVFYVTFEYYYNSFCYKKNTLYRFNNNAGTAGMVFLFSSLAYAMPGG